MRNRRLSFPVLTSRVALGAGLVLAGISAPSVARGQAAFPFPSTNIDPSRPTTDAITTYELEDLYAKWRADLIVDCGDDVTMLYPENNPPDVRSEGVGYGMVIAAYMGDLDTFDGLWSYYKRTSTNGLMNWRRNGCQGQAVDGNSNGSAADADIDAALGLIVAARQFSNDTYAAEARTLLNAIRTQLVEPANRACNGVLLPGSNYGGCGCVNPSYIPPGYYAAYAAFDTAQATSWNNARNVSYTLLAAAQNDTTGFVPAWSTSTGSTQLQNCQFQVAGGGNPDEYQSDAARTPWRVATDFLWTGEPRAETFLGVMADYVATQLPLVRVVDRYNLQGQPLGDNVASALGRRGSFHMGGFATAMTARSKADLDTFTAAWNSIYRSGDLLDGTLRAYNGSLAMLYGLLVTGTMWNPTGANPTPIARPALADRGANLLVNGDFTAGLRGWTTQSLSNPDSGDDSDGYAQHQAGEIHVHVLRNQADRAYGIQFYQDIALQNGQNYLVTLSARAAAPRPLRLVIGEVEDFDGNGQAYETYAQLTDGNGAATAGGEAAPTFNVGTTEATFSFVFTSPVTNNAARFNFQFGDATTEVIIDDVSVVPTTLPPTEVVEVVAPPPGATPPGATPGGGTAPSGGNIGQIPGQGDATGGGAVGQAPGGGDSSGVTGGSPPAPDGQPVSGTCTTDANCGGPFRCSTPLGLCYDPVYGYVWNGAAQEWQQPPRGVLGCGPYVYWPVSNACYDPETGYVFNPQTNQWQYVGDNYTVGQDPVDSGCNVAVSSRSGLGWAFVGLLGASAALMRRRRRA